MTAVSLFPTKYPVQSPKHHLNFFKVLFHWLHIQTRGAIGTAHLKDVPFLSSSECPNPGQVVLDAILILLVTPNAINCDEIIFLLARMSELNLEFFAIQEDMVGSSLERLINEVFLECLMTKKLEKKRLSMDYFTALKYFFNWKVVVQAYENDYYLLENLRQLIAVLWDEVMSKDLHKWDRLSIEKAKQWVKNVQVETESVSTEMELRKEEILQLFLIVQRIVHAIRNNSVRQAEVVLAFKTLLRLPLLARMSMVPENALKLDWSLTISCREDKIFVPLVNIHMLCEVDVLEDFVWRILWLGWTCRNQFEECWMSLFGVLSSTPTGAQELSSPANQNVFQQIQASSIAVEALTNLLVQTLLYPQPGNTTNSRYLVKHRSRKDANLFLESINGRLASISKAWLESDDQPSSIYIKNLDYSQTEDGVYSLGQTSVYYLWSITGLLEPNEQSNRQMKSTVSNYLIQMSTELDTASSLKALFENFMHWCSNGLEQLPVSLLSAMLKSLSILSDLFDDVTFYYFIFAKLRQLFISKYLDDHLAKGYLIYMLLKCAAVVEWKELLDSSSSLSTEAELARFVELIVENGLQLSQLSFVRYCTLHGILHLLQSLALDNVLNVVIVVTDFVMSELGRIQRPTDILTDCSPETIEYHKVVWAVGFRVVEEALPIDSMHKANFIKVVSNLFVDPRLATWHKRLLSRGIESLVIHSCSYSPKFRHIALECFDTFQLRPSHLPFALSVYITCVYRELQEGGEYAYLVNKSFSQDFQKLLNILSFYSTPSKCADIVPVLADLICLVWVKETVLENIWNLIAPIAAHSNQGVQRQNSNSKIFESIDSLPGQDVQLTNQSILPKSAILTEPCYFYSTSFCSN
uniref:Uncharacterized protein n=1 Tax=Ditylenchus dipsaci TaxID=166011 RepID=A0A915DP25_9BILA